jgi:thiamine pyrophosphokinase
MGYFMQGANVLIAANGNWPMKAIWKPLVDNCQFIVACDGAIVQLLQNDIIPDCIIGDLDSVPNEIIESQIKSLPITVIPMLNQNSSDLSKALKYCQSIEAKNIDVIGIEGGRLDHQIGAYFSLCEHNSHAILHLDNWSIRLVAKEGLTIDSIENGKNISLFAIGSVKGVNISGVKWPLYNEQLSPGTNGLHNESTGEEIIISHRGGDLIMLIER